MNSDRLLPRRLVACLVATISLVAAAPAAAAVSHPGDDKLAVANAPWWHRVGLDGVAADGPARLSVALVDTALDARHEDFPADTAIETYAAAERDASGFCGGDDCCAASGSAPRQFHATAVAGVIAAARGNGVGIAGIGHPARLIGIDAYAADAPRPRLASAIQCALDKGAKVINVSIQGLAAPEMPADLKAALDRAEALAVLVVMAAGNGIGDLDKEPEWPAAYRTHTTLTVTAVDLDDRLTGQRFGLHSVDLAVPAREDMVCSTLPESIPPHETKSAGCGVKGQEHSPYGRFGQTSAAAAIVSGAALLLWSHPNYRDCSAAEIRALLLKHARVPDAEATRTALSPFGGVLDVAFLATVVRNRAGVIDLCSGVVTSEAATEKSVPRSDGESHAAKDRSSGNEQP